LVRSRRSSAAKRRSLTVGLLLLMGAVVVFNPSSLPSRSYVSLAVASGQSQAMWQMQSLP
jgi:hypothetical protein